MDIRREERKSRTTEDPRRISSFSAPATVSSQLLNLQRSIGNGAVAYLLKGSVSPRQLPHRHLQRTIGDGHDLRCNRFAGNTVLESAYDSELTVMPGDSGLHVTILQQALVDGGFTIPPPGVNGSFNTGTEGAVSAFQTAKGLTGTAVTGTVNAQTMDLLDRHFITHAPERSIAANTTRALTEGTRALTASERAALLGAVTTAPRTSTGALPTFHRTIGSHPDPYETRIRNALNADITALHAQLVTARPTRTPAHLMAATEINRIATKAKDLTDAVFGRYRTGPALAYGVNIRDQYEVRDAEIAASPAAADAAAEWRVDKLLSGGDDIKQIDTEHGAVQSRSTEQSLIAPIKATIIASRRAELLAIHRNWPASAGGGQINLQRYRGTSPAQNRDILYRLLSTVIHEYIHTLENPAHVTFRGALPQQRGGFVLREGMTDYFAKIVWDGLTFAAPLRAYIEGTYHDPASPTSHPIPTPGRYTEWANAERAVGVIGVRNAMAAFFLGRTDLIQMT
jgi:peptidoglycan hydrolase-like protein with peptidoglycan-binding domain